MKEILRSKNISQKELAEKAGVTESTVSRYVNNQRGEFGHIKNLCETLGISADWLLDIKGDKQTPNDDLKEIRDICAQYMLLRMSGTEALKRIIGIVLVSNRGIKK